MLRYVQIAFGQRPNATGWQPVLPRLIAESVEIMAPIFLCQRCSLQRNLMLGGSKASAASAADVTLHEAQELFKISLRVPS